MSTEPNALSYWRILFAILAALPLAGCIGGTTPPSQFYMLEPIKAAEIPAGPAEKRVIALAPVRIPQYVDRPQIVTATGRNAYALSELNRWAERLDDNIARVLAQNLSLLVPADLVLLNATGRAKQAKLRVSVNLLEFHIDPQAVARMSAQWNIARSEDTVLARAFSCQEPATAGDYRSMAGALNVCLDRLSRDLADALRPLAE
jgi:uncharacterized lipoprotein YmbA